MAVCNLFKGLSKTTGNFLLFSQYSDDMTQFAADPNNHIVSPCSFYAVNMNFSEICGGSYPFEETVGNRRISEVLQKCFENGRAYIINHNQSDVGWNPSLSFQILLSTLKEHGLIDFTLSNANSVIVNEIVYKGSINIQSYDESLGYEEIYCHIPSDAKKQKFSCTVKEPDVVTDSADFIEGWSAGDWSAEDDIVDGSLSSPISYPKESFIGDIETEDIDSAESFDFNAIIVMYKVLTKNSSGIIQDSGAPEIPMGIYFTGKINSDETMGNAVTKYVSTDDTFGEGTSYGLRICSKFVTLPGGTKTITIETGSEQGNYAAFSHAMSLMAESQLKMDEVVKEIAERSAGIKTHLAQFTNGRVNVPYIREINGIQYWFVNGKNIGRVEVIGDDAFVVTYRETRFADVLKAYNSNRRVYLILDGIYYPMIDCSELSGLATFSLGNGVYTHTITLYDDDDWDDSTRGPLALKSDIGNLKFLAVESLPTNPDSNTIYFIKE